MTNLTPRPTRDGFGDALVEFAQKYPEMFVVDCAIASSMKTAAFAKEYPERQVDMGIAEQNAATFAAGLATTGFIPVVATYAVFGSMRMLEQVRTSICYPNLNVKICCSHGGLTPANDGATHQAVEDIGIYRSVPNMQVIMGADYYSTKALFDQAMQYKGPVYMRFTRDAMPIIYDENETFEIGKGKVLREGSDAVIIALGDMVCKALEAQETLKAEGVNVRVIDMHTVKPLDEELVRESIDKCSGRVVVAEDHNIHGGLANAVADVMAIYGKGKLRKIGIPDCYAESSPYELLLEKYGMDAKSIAAAVKELL